VQKIKQSDVPGFMHTSLTLPDASLILVLISERKLSLQSTAKMATLLD
jgi:hypothetical protein